MNFVKQYLLMFFLLSTLLDILRRCEYDILSHLSSLQPCIVRKLKKMFFSRWQNLPSQSIRKKSMKDIRSAKWTSFLREDISPPFISLVDSCHKLPVSLFFGNALLRLWQMPEYRYWRGAASKLWLTDQGREIHQQRYSPDESGQQDI